MPLQLLQRMFDLSAGFLKWPPECGKHSGADRAPGPDSHSSKFLQMSELSGSDTGTGSSSGSSSAGGGAPPVEHRKPSECCGTGQKSASEQETMGFSRSHMPGEAARGRSGMVCGAGAAGGGCGGLPLCPATGKEPADTGSGAGRAPGPDELYSDMFLRMPAFSGSDTGTGSGSGGSSSGGRAAPVKHRKPSGHRGTGRKSASEQETTGLSCSHMSEQVARGSSRSVVTQHPAVQDRRASAEEEEGREAGKPRCPSYPFPSYPFPPCRRPSRRQRAISSTHVETRSDRRTRQ